MLLSFDLIVQRGNRVFVNLEEVSDYEAISAISDAILPSSSDSRPGTVDISVKGLFSVPGRNGAKFPFEFEESIKKGPFQKFALTERLEVLTEFLSDDVKRRLHHLSRRKGQPYDRSLFSEEEREIMRKIIFEKGEILERARTTSAQKAAEIMARYILDVIRAECRRAEMILEAKLRRRERLLMHGGK